MPALSTTQQADANPFSFAAALYYEPTAEEEAYAVYLYEQLFGSFPANGVLNLQAKPTLAVLLETSGTDSIILRTIWTVAVNAGSHAHYDVEAPPPTTTPTTNQNTTTSTRPSSSQSLTNMGQLHVLLRLIALAQDGILETELNKAFLQEQQQQQQASTATSPKTKTTPVQVFQRILWMSQGMDDIDLPKFKHIPIPSHGFLQNLSTRIKGIPELSYHAPRTTTTLSDVAVPAPSPAPMPMPAPMPAPAPAPVPITTTSHHHRPSSTHVASSQVAAPAPAPIPLSAQTTAAVSPPKRPGQIGVPQKGDNRYTSIPPEVDVTKKPPTSEDTRLLQSAIPQMETLGVHDTPRPDSSHLQPLDRDNTFEWIQEQHALQRALLESAAAGPLATAKFAMALRQQQQQQQTNQKSRSSRPQTKKDAASVTTTGAVSGGRSRHKTHTTTTSSTTAKHTANPNGRLLSEEEALQQAIYESTHDAAAAAAIVSDVTSTSAAAAAVVAASPMATTTQPESSPVAAAAAPLHLQGGTLDRDDESDSERDYKRKKKKKGDAAYAEYLQSKIDNDHDLGEGGGTAQRKDLYNNPTMNSDDDDDSDKDDLDKKPAAKPAPTAKPAPMPLSNGDQKLPPASTTTPTKKPPPNSPTTTATTLKAATGKPKGKSSPCDSPTSKPRTKYKWAKSKNDVGEDGRVDEYPRAVQELVMNGFELEKAIQGYKMLGDNFDDIVLFLTSNITIKELVINGFNIHQVVHAYDLLGDDMDGLIAYLMMNANTANGGADNIA